MNCKITVTPDFLKEMKHLSKRYKSLKEDLNKLGDELERNPFLGVELSIICAKCVWLSLRKEKVSGAEHGLLPTR